MGMPMFFLFLVLAAIAVYRRMRRPKGVLFIANLDGLFDPPTGDDEPKIIKLGPRLLWLAMLLGVKDVIVVLYEPLSEEYARDVRAVLSGLGLNVRFVVPRQFGQPLCLAQAVIDDRDLLVDLGDRCRGWVVDAYIEHPSVADLAEKLELRMARTSRRLVRGGLVQWTNDKGWFARVCRWIAIPTTNPAICLGVEAIERAAARLFAAGWREIMIRGARGAGNLRNRSFRSVNGLLRFLQDQPADGPWYVQDVLVEPYFGDIPESQKPVAVGHVHWWGPSLLDVTIFDRIVTRGNGSEGCSGPSALPWWIQIRLGFMLWRFGLVLWLLGYRGPYDMDFGIRRNGRIVAFESNVRYQATSTGIGPWIRLAGRRGVMATCDGVDLVGSYSEFRAFLRSQGIWMWSAVARESVIPTIDPRGGTYTGYVILAPTRARLGEIQSLVKHWISTQKVLRDRTGTG